MNRELKNKAILLRKQGYSYREISLELSISKSTASIWGRFEELDKKARNRIRSLGNEARRRAAQTNKKKRELAWREIAWACPVLRDGVNYSVNEYKMFLALLYWAEGEKTRGKFAFVNSDSAMLKLYLFLLRKSFVIDESRFKVWLHLHEYHNQDEMIAYWSKVTGICIKHFSVYNKPHTGVNKRKGYKGCLSITYRDSRIVKELFIIIKRFRKFN